MAKVPGTNPIGFTSGGGANNKDDSKKRSRTEMSRVSDQKSGDAYEAQREQQRKRAQQERLKQRVLAETKEREKLAAMKEVEAKTERARLAKVADETTKQNNGNNNNNSSSSNNNKLYASRPAPTVEALCKVLELGAACVVELIDPEKESERVRELRNTLPVDSATAQREQRSSAVADELSKKMKGAQFDLKASDALRGVTPADLVVLRSAVDRLHSLCTDAAPGDAADVKHAFTRLVALIEKLALEQGESALALRTDLRMAGAAEASAQAERDEKHAEMRRQLHEAATERDGLVLRRRSLLEQLSSTRAELTQVEASLGALAQRLAQSATSAERAHADAAAATRHREHQRDKALHAALALRSVLTEKVAAARRAADSEARAVAARAREIQTQLRKIEAEEGAQDSQLFKRLVDEMYVMAERAHAMSSYARHAASQRTAGSKDECDEQQQGERNGGRVALLHHALSEYHAVPAQHREQPARARVAVSAMHEVALSRPAAAKVIEAPEVGVDARYVEGVVHAPSYIADLHRRAPSKFSQLLISVEQSQKIAAAAAAAAAASAAAATTTTAAAAAQVASGENGDSLKMSQAVAAMSSGGDQTALPTGDTYLSPDTLMAAYGAASTVCHAVDLVSGDAPAFESAFCAVRPPGHHVGRSGATAGVPTLGYCILNSIAIGAHYAMLQHNYKRIAIVDFDVHHGNGTEEIFRAHSAVLFCSVHVYAPRIEFYPCTGPPEAPKPLDIESLRDDNTHPKPLLEHNVLNVPLKVGVTAQEFRASFDTVIVPALDAFKPDLILISAGFDGHRDDPYGQWIGSGIAHTDYGHVTAALRATAVKHGAPLVSVLEGGYNLVALRKNVREHILALI